jgi:RNA polymerase sigma-70 factor (TIGR02960 family)
VTDTTLARAREGDADAFRDLTEPHRRELQVHCYRILGSMQDAEDMVQETLLAAWRGLGKFEERSSVRSWLYRIATNRCLNAARDAGRARRRVRLPAFDAPEPTRRSKPTWFEPYPDALVEDLPDTSPGPEARYETREALALAFVGGLQRLPPRQRAVLVLRDVLGFRAAETADMLDSSEVSVNSALRRARASLDTQLPPRDRDRAPLPRSAREREIVTRFVDAFEGADIDRMIALLTEDAWMTMPPEPLEYQGRAAIAEFYLTRAWWGTKKMHLVPTRASNQPALGIYLRDPQSPVAHPHSLLVLTLDPVPSPGAPGVPSPEAPGLISVMTRFHTHLFPAFGLPPTLQVPLEAP